VCVCVCEGGVRMRARAVHARSACQRVQPWGTQSWYSAGGRRTARACRLFNCTKGVVLTLLITVQYSTWYSTVQYLVQYSTVPGTVQHSRPPMGTSLLLWMALDAMAAWHGYLCLKSAFTSTRSRTHDQKCTNMCTPTNTQTCARAHSIAFAWRSPVAFWARRTAMSSLWNRWNLICTSVLCECKETLVCACLVLRAGQRIA